MQLRESSHWAPGSISSITPSTSPLLYLCSTSTCRCTQHLRTFYCSIALPESFKSEQVAVAFGSAHIIVLKYDVLSLQASAFPL